MKSFVKSTSGTSRRSQSLQILLSASELPSNPPKNQQMTHIEDAIHDKWSAILDKAVNKESIPESLIERIDAMLSK